MLVCVEASVDREISPVNRRYHAKSFSSDRGAGMRYLFAVAYRPAVSIGIERGLRVAKLAGGGLDARREAHFIVSEKVSSN